MKLPILASTSSSFYFKILSLSFLVQFNLVDLFIRWNSNKPLRIAISSSSLHNLLTADHPTFFSLSFCRMLRNLGFGLFLTDLIGLPRPVKNWPYPQIWSNSLKNFKFWTRFSQPKLKINRTRKSVNFLVKPDPNPNPPAWSKYYVLIFIFLNFFLLDSVRQN